MMVSKGSSPVLRMMKWWSELLSSPYQAAGKLKRLFVISVFLASPCFGQAWSGVIAPSRAADWTKAGLPGDVPPDASWTQSGSTIVACGSSGSAVSPSTCGITAALAACGTNHYVLLGKGDFYLTGSINMPSNCVLRGSGASQTRLHAAS